MEQPYIITVSSEKGGVGKTTLATNLAIYLKALREDLPVTLFSFDNHFSVDRMFRIGRGAPRGDVLTFLEGGRAQDLVETGEFGVQFIPSSRQLSRLRQRCTGLDSLALLLAAAELTGVVIIDTRPDLDILTLNALFAADRVIVPVKDASSLENCKNLYDFFADQGLPRSTLRILPCLIDQRIRYSGPFSDPYRLLKAYAINRGYRCLEGYIAKSPKVESLNTNPEGKIYSILSHGRSTDVHLQFAHLARQIYLDGIQDGTRRLDQVQVSAAAAHVERQEAFVLRRQQLQPECPLCGKGVISSQGIAPVGYYAVTSDGRFSGFLEEECFSEAVFRNFYRSRHEVGPVDPLRDLFRESAQRSLFVLRRAPHTQNFYQPQLSFYRFDEEGLEVSHKTIDLKEHESRFLKKEPSSLYRLAQRTLFDAEGRLGDEFLLIRRVNVDFPEEILYDEHYGALQRIGEKIASQLR